MSQTKMKPSPDPPLAPVRFENGKTLLIAGLRVYYKTAPLEGSAEQWQRLASYFGKIPGQMGNVGYGLCFLRPDGIDYLAGVLVAADSGLPNELATVQIPSQRYAVFGHDGHVSQLHKACQQISEWLPTSTLQVAKAEGSPDFFELYTEKFDPVKGVGGMEIWVPIKK